MIERLLASKANRLLAVVLFVYLVVLPLAGVDVPTGAELIGGNFTNVTGYLAASIAAGASVTHLAEGRRHRRAELEHREREAAASARRERHLAAIRAHLTARRPYPDEESSA